MTHTIRTTATIEAAIASITKMLDDVEQFMQDLRNEPCKRVYVVGFPQYGLYVHPKGGVGSVLAARLLDRPAAVELARRVTNGKAELAVAIDYERAIAMVLTMQQDLHSNLCGMYRDLLQELVDTRAYEADMDARADAEAAAYAMEGDFYGMHEERARHP